MQACPKVASECAAASPAGPPPTIRMGFVMVFSLAQCQ
jgi:hypothetical protein